MRLGSSFFLFVIGLCFPLLGIDWDVAGETTFSSAVDIEKSIGRGADGTAVMIYQDSGSLNLQAVVYDPGTQSWSSPTEISHGSQVTVAVLSVNDSGHAMIAWVDNSAMNLSICTYNGSSWNTGSQQVFSGSSISNIDIAYNQSGEALCAWASGVIPSQLQSAGFNGSSWSSASIIETSMTGGFGDTNVVLNSAGQGAVSWRDVDGAIKASFYTGWGVWTSPTQLSDMGETVDSGTMAIAPDPVGGYPLILASWRLQSTSALQTAASHFNSLSWGAPIAVGTGRSPSLSMNNQTAWITYTVSNTQVHTAFLDLSLIDSATWQSSQTYTAAFVFSSKIAVNNRGTAVLVYKIFDGSAQILTASYKGSWDASAFLLDSGGSQFGSASYDVCVANASRSYAAVNWAFTSTSVWVALGFDSQATVAPDPPASLTGSIRYDRFATQAERVKQIVWTASPSPSVTSYNIYRSEVWIGNVLSTSVLLFDDHLQPNIPTLYQVRAVNTDGESSALSIVL